MHTLGSYTKAGTWTIALLLGALAGCGGDGGRDPVLGTGDNVASPPSVTAVAPESDATNVPLATSVVTATLREPVDPFTGTSTFTLTCVAPCVNPLGTVTLDSTATVASFTLNAGTALQPATRYTATVTGARSVATGLAMGTPYQWSFTTGGTPDSTRPTVSLTIPATAVPATTAVAVNRAIVATFSESMAQATIGAASFTLTCVAPCVSPAGTVSYSAVGNAAVFTPTAGLEPSTTYTATITSAATDLAGNALSGNQGVAPAASNFVWTFTTGALTDSVAPTVLTSNPVNLSVDTCVNQSISATFSDAIDPLTLTPSTFTLGASSGGSVTGLVSYDPQTQIATFNPVADLVAATVYTATIVSGPNGVKDLGGNELAADSVTTFTTSAVACAVAPPLGAAARFGGFGGNATLTNDGLNTVINGDVGVNASSTTVTGLRDAGGNVYTVTPNNDGLVNGLIYTLTAPPGSVAGAAVTQARADALVAFNAISPASLPGGIDVSSVAQCPSCGGAGGGPDELAGRVLPPGVYLSTTGTYDIGGVGRTTANLTLDAGGNADAVWVFQAAAGIGTLNVGLTGPATPAVPIQVLLINGAQAKNVFWYVPAGATIGTGSAMVGTLLADASITISTTGGTPPTAVNTTLNGRAIALTAGVTMTNTLVNVPAP